MIFKLTEAQEECLKGAEGQPVGRKGEKWLAWANSVLEEEGLPPVEVEKDEPESHTKSTSKQQQQGKPANPAQPQHLAQQQQQGEIHLTRTFVVQSGVLKGPGVSFRFNEGIMTGYFKVTRETPSKAAHDDLRIELPAGMMLDGPSEAAAAAGGVQEKKAEGPSGAAAAAAGGGAEKTAAGGSVKKAGGPSAAAAGGVDKVSDSDDDDDSKDSDDDSNNNKDSEKESDDSEEFGGAAAAAGDKKKGADKTAAQMTPTRGGKRKETDGQTTDKNKKGRLGMRM